MSWNPFINEHIHPRDGFLLNNVFISILLFADDVVLLASTPGYLDKLYALSRFCELRQLMVNLGKPKL
jgi:hypothetical protein